jgi:hypothetical protein
MIEDNKGWMINEDGRNKRSSEKLSVVLYWIKKKKNHRKKKRCYGVLE